MSSRKSLKRRAKFPKKPLQCFNDTFFETCNLVVFESMNVVKTLITLAKQCISTTFIFFQFKPQIKVLLLMALLNP